MKKQSKVIAVFESECLGMKDVRGIIEIPITKSKDTPHRRRSLRVNKKRARQEANIELMEVL